MWELDCKEGWAPKNWCFQIVVLEKTLQSPLDSKEIKPVNLKGNQPWIFTGRTNAEAEAPILGPPDAKSWFFLEKTLMLEKTEGKRRGQQRMRCLDSITNSMDMILSQLQETMENRGACHAAVHWVKSWTQLSDWTTTALIPPYDSCSQAFLMVFSAYKLNKQGDSMQPCHVSQVWISQLFHVQF